MPVREDQSHLYPRELVRYIAPLGRYRRGQINTRSSKPTSGVPLRVRNAVLDEVCAKKREALQVLTISIDGR